MSNFTSTVQYKHVYIAANIFHYFTVFTLKSLQADILLSI